MYLKTVGNCTAIFYRTLNKKLKQQKQIDMLKLKLVTLLLVATFITAFAQPERWQQRAEYEMDIEMDAKKHQFKGKQKLKYFNNSPDKLTKVFYHLYFNAFQPGSMMDVRSQALPDPDPRVRDRISKLEKKEIGYQEIKSLKMNGKPCDYTIVGTILEVSLPMAIEGNSTAVFEMEFEGQVPLQVRRSGRDNKEGIEFSMAQWYPKMSEYDYQGWHANPYVGREFHGIWGDYDVSITMDKDYIIAGTGVLQNPQEIGYGYEAEGQAVKQSSDKNLTWHFKAENVHDFVWTADPDYTHTKIQVPDGPMIHFFYQPGKKTTENWDALPEYAVKLFQYASANFGKYPYPTYSIIQGGDGGMEYPMATLITGERKLNSLIGVTVHEVMHSWYQMILGSNEALYYWMDEGFTSHASSRIMASMFEPNPEGIHAGSYSGYYYIAKSGVEEPLTTHADHFKTNTAYGIAAYSKGAVFLNQLEYIVGKPIFDKALLAYFEAWKFKHPNSNDVIRIFEKESGLELDWYREYFVFTTKQIDYGVKSVEQNKKKSKTDITLERVGDMPMPMDIIVEYTDGSKESYYVPMVIMRGNKVAENSMIRKDLADWAWTNTTYTFTIDHELDDVKSVTIDPSKRIADVNDANNIWESEGS
jgi:hypothetical protein